MVDRLGTGTAGTGLTQEQEMTIRGKGMPFTNLMLIPTSLIPLTMSVWTSSMQVMQSTARSVNDLSLGAIRSWVDIVQNSTSWMGGMARAAE
jgi:hypothetical protein